MLDIILKILLVLGIVLLALLLLSIVLVLLVLFFPVTYKVHGEKSETDMKVSLRMNWLFGFLRLRYAYPEPGLLTAKILCFRLYQKKLPNEGEEADEDKNAGGRRRERRARKKSKGEAKREDQDKTLKKEEEAELATPTQTSTENEFELEETDGEEAERESEETTDTASSDQDDSRPAGLRERILKKFQKIKYTICNIYDKIKGIWENISYYIVLLQEQNTKELFVYAKLRVFKVLKNIRPRHIRADILFGTGAPDTTGYAYGVYCMCVPFLGSRFLVTPDFDRAVFQGRLDISGHVTVFVLVFNVVRLVFDRKIQRFIKEIKNKSGKEQRG